MKIVMYAYAYVSNKREHRGGKIMNLTKRLLLVALAVVMVFAALVGCAAPAAGTPAAAETIKIGVFEPMTGANAGGGTLEVKGIDLANKLRPTVNGKTVELVKADNKSDTVEAASAAARLVESGVSAIIGSWGSGLSIAAGDVVRDAKVPAVGASCTNPLVTQGNDWYFRVCFIDPYQGKVMANYAYTVLGKKKAAIIREVSNDYSVGLAQFFTEAFKGLGGTIVAEADYNTNDQDFNAQITNVMQANPEVIFAPGNFTESALIVKQARELGYDVPFLGGDTWETPELLEVGGAAVEGIVFSTFFDSNSNLTPMTKTFVDAYKAEYNEEPAAVSALSFDAYNLILDAIEKSGATGGEELRAAIEATKDFEGAAGVVNFDENGDATKDAVIKEVKDGKFTYKTTVGAEG